MARQACLRLGSLGVAMAALVRAAVAAAAAGDLDPSFGIGGRIDMTVTSFDPDPRDLALQSDGKIVSSVNGPFSDTFVSIMRLNPGGDLDTTFGDAGRVIVPDSSQAAHQVVIFSDGGITSASTAQGGVRLAGLTPSGSVDSAFGSGGAVFTPLCGAPTLVMVNDAIVQPDDKLLVLAHHPCGPVLLVRYERDGTLDATFGTGGVVSADLPPIDEEFVRLLLQPDGGIVLFGNAGSGEALVARYDALGVLDAAFGTAGVVTLAGVAGRVAGVRLPGGEILVAGSSTTPGMLGTLVFVRLEANGTLDGTFGSGGSAAPGTPSLNEEGFVALQPDGKIVALQSTVLYRYETDGTLDGSFGDGGVALEGALDFFPFKNIEYVYGMGVDAGGRIVVGTARVHIDGRDRRMTFRRVLMECGDGAPDPGEVCDDGNVFPGDCCTPVCAFAATGAPCDGDGDLCTHDECDGGGTCTVVGDEPQPTGCRLPFTPGKSVLILQNDADPTRRRLIWKWPRGSATVSEAFGAPDVLPTEYALCAFDTTLVAPNRILGVQAPGAGTCGTKPCWTARGSATAGAVSYKYKDTAGGADGVSRIGLKPGADNKAKMTLKAGGANLTLPPMPFAPASVLRVQLKNGFGECWEATYPVSSASSNLATIFKARSE